MKLVTLAAFALALSCSPADRQAARDVTDAALAAKDLACIMGSFLVDPAELAKVCGLADRFVPIVRSLVGVRDASRRAGVTYVPPPLAAEATDAGKP